MVSDGKEWLAVRGRYAAIGAVLGIGAPAGALLLRMVLDPAVRFDPLTELRTGSFFYLYSLIGTSVVFAFAGAVAGAHAERLRAAEEFYRRLADRDALTGLLNARAFEDRFSRALERSTRFGEPMALLLIDVDWLKAINDEQGHVRGNAALVQVAAAIGAAKRGSDEAARWGGDEFAVLLQGGDQTAAVRTAEAIMAWLAENPLPNSPSPLTVTIGIAIGIPRPDHGDFFGAADRALYAGKRDGRNQIRVATIS